MSLWLSKKYKRCCLLTRPIPLSQEEKFFKSLNEAIENDEFDDELDDLFCDCPFCLSCSDDAFQPFTVSMSFGFEGSSEIIHI